MNFNSKIISAVLLTITAPVLYAQCLLANPDMENSENTTVKDWKFIAWDRNAPCEGLYDSTQAKSKLHSLKITTSDSEKVGKGKWFQTIDVKGSTFYELSGYIKSEKLTEGSAYLQVLFFDDAGRMLLVKNNVAIPTLNNGTRDWTLSEITVKSPEQAVKAEIVFVIYMAKGTVWADDLQFAALGILSDQPGANGNIVLLDETATIYKWRGITATNKNAKFGKYSALWTNPTETGGVISIEDFPHDWSKYSGLSFWIYSEVANGEEISVACTSEDQNSKGWAYYKLNKNIKVDWTGWKFIVLNFGDFNAVRNTVGWQKIDRLSLHIGWGRKPQKDSLLYIDRMELIGRIGEKTDVIARDVKPNTMYTISLVKNGGPVHINIDWLNKKDGKPLTRATRFIFFNNDPEQYEKFIMIETSPFNDTVFARFRLKNLTMT